MDKQQAKRIVQTTLDQPFQKERYALFIKNLLKSVEDAPLSYKGNLIPAAFTEYVSSYERICKYTDGKNEIDVLIVHLKRETSIERARTMQRNFIARYLNGSRGGKLKDAALVAFVSPDTEDWRFSLVKMDYRFEEGKNGKVKVKEEFTPARRWSFLVGTNENSHTAQSRLAPVLEDDSTKPLLLELEECFNIETVTKEFFEKYRDLFIWIKQELDDVVDNDKCIREEFETKNVNTVDFAKKLLGQIVFLYFLQKKGWFGVQRGCEWGSGSKQFLRELFIQKHGKHANFFNDILEPLFYDALRIDRSHDDHYYRMFNCKIPFLNGGLFDPIGNYDWVNTDIIIPNELFSNTRKTKEGDIGNGVLDVFDRYNFTVKEDEPLEKEVAIDPELLGKTYEKFNAIRPDNFAKYLKALKSGKKGEESKFNKQYGVYYTPREIVHYMCQQSLVNYLFTRLNNSTVSHENIRENNLDMFGNKGKDGQLDISIEHRGSPKVNKEDIEKLIHHGESVTENEARVEIKGKETERYFYKLSEDIRISAGRIDKMLEEIKVCDPAIGSGAFPVGMMSEITKARNTLSAYLKEPERKPYHFKRNCIENSLYGVDIDSGAVEIAKLRLWLSLVVDEEDIREIQPLPNLDYKIVCGNSLIGLPDGILVNDAIINKLEELKEAFVNETNPTLKNKIRAEINRGLDELVASAKQFSDAVTDSTFDFHIHFSEAFPKSGKQGFDVVIGNPPWGSELSKEDKMTLKKRFTEIDSSTPNSYAYFLGLASKISQGNIAFILPDSILVKDYAKTRKSIYNSLKTIKWYQNVGLPDIIRPFENVEHDVSLLILNSDKSQSVFCSTSSYDNQHKLMKTKDWVANKNEIIMEEFDFVYNLKITAKDIQILNKIRKFNRISDFLQCHEGIHTGNCRDVLFKETKENKHCKPLFYGGSAGDEINNFASVRSGWYVDYRNDIINDKKGEYASLRDERIFKYPKIYITRTGNPFKAFLDVDSYASNNFFSLQYADYSRNTIENLKYVLPFIICKLSQYFIRTFAAPRLGDIFIETKILHLLKFRIPALTDSQRSNIVSVVDSILALTQDPECHKAASIINRLKKYEEQIDNLIYDLYDLTADEIDLVEGRFIGQQL
ncbi:MAG: N-6 DNA methylase [Fibrobacteres bacterium]|nr:N-6 DNA methylase [Fibrobacterota bacterium]